MSNQYSMQATSMDQYQRQVMALKANREAAEREYQRLWNAPDPQVRLASTRELIRTMNIEVTYREGGWPSWTGARQDAGHIGFIVTLRGKIAALEWEEANIMQSAGSKVQLVALSRQNPATALMSASAISADEVSPSRNVDALSLGVSMLFDEGVDSAHEAPTTASFKSSFNDQAIRSLITASNQHAANCSSIGANLNAVPANERHR
ncbi:hypothetical protein B0H13DRAFT_2679935 [Mycena leptocephala]|nr:hypothetical protein B0H13DRAFT_2679935 [Mycena leptocephala]